MRVSPRSAAVVGFLVLALALGYLYGRGTDSQDRIAILSVGQGDSAVVQSQGRTALIDAGPATERLDSGSRFIVPALGRLGVGAIDMVILSHPDQDHIGGLRAIMARYDVGKIVVPACFRGHPQLRDLPASKTLWLERSAVIRLGNAVLQLEAPVQVQPDKENDGSAFVRIVVGKSAAVFSGDAPMEVENAMVRRLPDWRAQILHAGHHGSRTSTGSSWLAAVRPRIVAISCGRNNRYGHPHASVLAAIAAAGAQTARTDREGDLVFEATATGFRQIRDP